VRKVLPLEKPILVILRLRSVKYVMHPSDQGPVFSNQMLEEFVAETDCRSIS